MAAYQIAQFPAVAPVAAPAGGRTPTWVGIVPGCYEAAILVEAVLQGQLTAVTRDNTGNTQATPASGMVFVYKRDKGDMQRFTARGIKFSDTRWVNAGNAAVSIDVVERKPKPEQGRWYEPQVTYGSTADLQLDVDAPASLDLASVRWDQRTAAGDWLRQTVGDNTLHFPFSIRGGMVKKVFTVTVPGAGVYTVVSLYTVRDTWPGRMRVPSDDLPLVIPRQAVIDGFKKNEDFGPVDTVVYDMQQGPVNCMAYAQAKAAAAPAPAAVGPQLPPPHLAGPGHQVQNHPPQPPDPQQPPDFDLDAHIADIEAYSAACQDAHDLAEFHLWNKEETQETSWASMLSAVQGGSDEDVAMADGSGSEDAPGGDLVHINKVPDTPEDIDLDDYIDFDDYINYDDYIDLAGACEMDTAMG